MSTNNVTEEAESSLNRILDIFNATDDNLTYNGNNNILKDSSFDLNPKLSQSVDLKSFIDGEDDENSDLWQMQSLHGSFNNETNDNLQKINDKNEVSPKIITIPEFDGPQKPLTKFVHIQSKQIPKFESFLRRSDKDKSDFIDFRGLSPPICTFQTMHNQNIHKKSDREYYRMLIPPIYSNQNILLLCCRKKRNVDKWRFSSDEYKLEKKNNPYYIGKMKVIKKKKHKFVTFMVTLKNEKQVCFIKIIVEPNKVSHFVEVTLLLNDDNLIEFDKTMKGTINNFVEPKLNLIISSSHRTVLNITDCVNCIENELKPPQNKSNKISNVQMIDFDYPLSIFVSFAITTAINCRHLFL